MSADLPRETSRETSGSATVTAMWECKDCGRTKACASQLMALVLWLDHWADCPKREA